MRAAEAAAATGLGGLVFGSDQIHMVAPCSELAHCARMAKARVAATGGLSGVLLIWGAFVLRASCKSWGGWHSELLQSSQLGHCGGRFGSLNAVSIAPGCDRAACFCCLGMPCKWLSLHNKRIDWPALQPAASLSCNPMATPLGQRAASRHPGPPRGPQLPTLAVPRLRLMTPSCRPCWHR